MTPGTVWTMSSEEKQPAEMKTGPKVSDQLENLKSKKKKQKIKRNRSFYLSSSPFFLLQPSSFRPLLKSLWLRPRSSLVGADVGVGLRSSPLTFILWAEKPGGAGRL